MPEDFGALEAAIQHTRNASQALWDARTKGTASIELNRYLEPSQLQLQLTLELLEESRDFLKHRASL